MMRFARTALVPRSMRRPLVITPSDYQTSDDVGMPSPYSFIAISDYRPPKRGAALDTQCKLLAADLQQQSMPAEDICQRISTFDTQYARLFLLARDEFAAVKEATNSPEVIEVDHQTAMKTSARSVELDQLKKRLRRVGREESDLRGARALKEARLEELNEMMTKLTRLAAQAGVLETEQQTRSPGTRGSRSELGAVASMPLDDEKYKELWKEQAEYVKEVAALRDRLKEVQGRQYLAVQEKAKELVKQRRRGRGGR